MNKRVFSLLSVTVILAIVTLFLWFWADIVRAITEAQAAFHQLLSQHIGQFNEHPTRSGLLLIGISFLYGVFHAAGPGHGKAVLVTYLSTQKESLRQSLLISFAAAIFQALVAVAVVTLISLILNQTFAQVNTISARAEQSSYVLVMIFGGYLLFQALNRARVFVSRTGLVSSSVAADAHSHEHHHNHNHNDDPHNYHNHNHEHHEHHEHYEHYEHDHHSHDHYHEHDHHGNCCNHTYVAEEKISFWQTVGLVVAMGARPCTGAIMVLIYAKIVGIYWVGVLSTLLMGFGTGLTIALLGSLTVIFREKLSAVLSDEEQGHSHGFMRPLLSSLGGVLLIALGWSLFQASVVVSTQHPLF